MHIPPNWTFENASIAQNFDRHVREQLPFYDLATGAVAHIARHYVPQGGVVYDIGASTGNIARALQPMLIERSATLIPVESSLEMAARYTGPGADLMICGDAEDQDYQPCDLIVLFLTAMFLPVCGRKAFLGYLRSHLRPGGAMIIVDKCQASTGYAATVLWRLTLAGKIAAGVNADEIVAKELSLGGVQRPLSPRELPDDAIEWLRFGEFCGWLIEAKP
jgi:tRNA (cmo5U34)-methyltransferase